MVLIRLVLIRLVLIQTKRFFMVRKTILRNDSDIMDQLLKKPVPNCYSKWRGSERVFSELQN